MKHPGSVNLDLVEVERIERAQVALLLNITPEQVDDMPMRDVDDILAIHRANNEIETWQRKIKSR